MTHRRNWVIASSRVGRGNLSMALELSGPEPWMLEGLCAQADPEAWYPEKGGSTRLAKRVCMGCPVQVECLQYALDHHEMHGVWGAKSYKERQAMTPITSEEVRLRVAEVHRLTAEGWSTIAIAVELEIGQAVVHFDRLRPLEQLEAS